MAKDNTAKILQGAECAECKWPIISVCCNDGMAQTEPYSHSDYWAYCSNKTCQHHVGESLDQFDPDFVIRIP